MDNVIVVTLNYRLHVLGFLSLPSEGISGNAGLKDQQMALEWVFDNISCFNGDPNKICLFGESAGGASVHLQVLNSKSRKFINTSIIQSGCAIGDWLLQKDAVSVTRKLAKLLGAKTGSDSDALVTLMSASAEDLFRLKSKPQDPDDRRRNLTFTFKPSIEINSPAAFMHESPAKLIMMQAGQIKIPMIFGTTSIDGSVMVANYRHMTDIFNSDLVRLVPQSLSIDPNSHSAKLLAEEIKKFYFGEEKIEEKTVTNFINHQTDFHFSVPQTIAVELHKLHHSESKVFLYEFRFDGELNMYKKFFQMEHIPGNFFYKFKLICLLKVFILKGAAHADELCYLFK